MNSILNDLVNAAQTVHCSKLFAEEPIGRQAGLLHSALFRISLYSSGTHIWVQSITSVAAEALALSGFYHLKQWAETSPWLRAEISRDIRRGVDLLYALKAAGHHPDKRERDTRIEDTLENA